MKVLVVVTDYPNLQGGLALAYVRTRNVYYKERGMEVEVLNFSANEDYSIDGIHVFCLKNFDKIINENKYDLLICHAPNIRNHYFFIEKYDCYFKKIILFFHGHEVLKVNKVYSVPYPFVKRNKLLENVRDLYDECKFFVWRRYIEKNYKKLAFVFVSRWMKEEFLYWVHPSIKCLEGRNFVTYNCVGSMFEKGEYDVSSQKQYDFVTIRANLDGSKYCVDIVNELAKRNPDLSFLLIGKGEFFKYYEKADNLTWLDCRLNHEEMIAILNSAKCALMPTRTDAQGVMMCEMVAFGMPLITSDIPICHEVFDNVDGVGFISNEELDSFCLKDIYENIKKSAGKSDRYFMKNTGEHEVIILSNLCINVNK